MLEAVRPLSKSNHEVTLNAGHTRETWGIGSQVQAIGVKYLKFLEARPTPHPPRVEWIFQKVRNISKKMKYFEIFQNIWYLAAGRRPENFHHPERIS